MSGQVGCTIRNAAHDLRRLRSTDNDNIVSIGDPHAATTPWHPESLATLGE